MSGALEKITKFASAAEFAAEYGQTALRFYLLEISRALIPDERIRVCWRYPLPQRDAVEIIYSDERARARSSGTMKCGSGWVCPVCMGHIHEQRRVELQTAMDHVRDSLVTVMVTYTVQHDAGSRLSPLIASMTDAYRKTRSGRYWQDVKTAYGIVGSVRALEVTHGENGWHPHLHELMFLRRDVLSPDKAGGLDELADGLRGDIGGQWYEKILSNGLYTDIDRAFDVKAGNQYSAEYIAKFGRLPRNGDLSVSAYELTSPTTKNANRAGFGPLDILFAAGKSTKYQNLWREYAAATKGRSQLHWSRGLKDLLDIEVIRDEIAAQGVETETDRLLAKIDLDMWRWIAWSGFLGQLMTKANTGDEVIFRDYLDRLDERRRASQPMNIQWSPGM